MLIDQARGLDLDLDGPVQLAPRVWWVGAMLPGDRFQCHVYLIEQGSDSVLIDPGSALSASAVAAKVDEVVGLDQVGFVVCSHSDPDITGAIPRLLQAGLRRDASLVTHWRDAALLRHLGLELPFWLVDEHDWHLLLDDRALRFVFTPYAHFAGAFCTFDEASGTLFSSDLFGGFTEDAALIAPDLDLDGLRAFHQHYMPSREVLVHALDQIEPLPVTMVAPQHGHVLLADQVAQASQALRSLECGLYLLAAGDPGLAFLLQARRVQDEITAAVLEEARFALVARRVASICAETFAICDITFWATAGDVSLRFDGEHDYQGAVDVPPESVSRGMAGAFTAAGARWVVPLSSPDDPTFSAVAAIEFSAPTKLEPERHRLVLEMGEQIGVSLRREVVRWFGELDREALYERAVHDPLTGLFSRGYLQEVLPSLCPADDGGAAPRPAALMIDLDHFKLINDTHGHGTGDLVLQGVARRILESTRDGDVAVRFGGEEFLVLLPGASLRQAALVAERVRAAVEGDVGAGVAVTVSVGVARQRAKESCEALVKRADEALYRAKEQGRNRVA
jgi:diguanylate cyclase (GGDEF)-like protein